MINVFMVYEKPPPEYQLCTLLAYASEPAHDLRETVLKIVIRGGKSLVLMVANFVLRRRICGAIATIFIVIPIQCAFSSLAPKAGPFSNGQPGASRL